MSLAERVVGIDYHQKHIQVCVMSMAGQVVMNRRCNNDVGEVARMLSGQSIESLAIEASTGSAAFADAMNSATGLRVKLCHPGYVSRMKGSPDKSDLSDAQLIADLNRVKYLPEVWLAPEAVRDMRTLVRHRDTCVQRCKNTKLRIRAVLRQYRVMNVPKGLWSKAGIVWLREVKGLPAHSLWVIQEHLEELVLARESIKRCDVRLKVFAKQDHLVQRLLKEKGIGIVTASVMRAEIGTFTRFRTGKQLSRFCALSPRNCSSGERQADAGLIRAGNPLLKKVLIEAAHGLVRYHEHWSKFSARLKAHGKPSCVVVAAVANRWLRHLHHKMVQAELN